MKPFEIRKPLRGVEFCTRIIYLLRHYSKFLRAVIKKAASDYKQYNPSRIRPRQQGAVQWVELWAALRPPGQQRTAVDCSGQPRK